MDRVVFPVALTDSIYIKNDPPHHLLPAIFESHAMSENKGKIKIIK